MNYPDFSKADHALWQMREYGMQQSELGRGEAVTAVFARVADQLGAALAEIRALKPDAGLARREPEELAAIHQLRPAGPRTLVGRPDRAALADKMAGAVLGRFAGCCLGLPVEGWPVDRMKDFARQTGTPFPPTEYWHDVTDPEGLHYGVSPRRAFSLSGMNGVPVDDDLIYTQIALLVLEKHGFGFSTEDVGAFWREHLPIACTAEDIALKNLKASVPAALTGEVDNPWTGIIGAAIRSDGWAWACAGRPEQAAELAYRDAWLSHRRNGVYGEMFWAAAQAAAFAANNVRECLDIGLTEIPAECELAHDIRWALDLGPRLADYLAARQAVDERFPGMPSAHTRNNACLTVFGLLLGDGDFTQTIALTVAMGLDNDCTAATAGSLLGALVGRAGIDRRWTRGFGNTVHTYLTGVPPLTLGDLIARFVRLAEAQLPTARSAS